MDDRKMALEAAAQSWVGTPFCENSAVKGAGVSCHLAVFEVYVEAGVMERVAVPLAPLGWAKAQDRSLMEEWLDDDEKGFAWFTHAIGRPKPGDLLGFNLGRCVHHLAIQLGEGRIFHAMQNVGAIIAPSLPPQWEKRLARVWRPRFFL